MVTTATTSPIVYVDTEKVSCDGGELGHPLVYLVLDGGEVECPYCGRKFMFRPEPDKTREPLDAIGTSDVLSEET